MAHLIITLLLAICLAGNAVGQPRVVGMHRFDDETTAFDIYATEDGGFAVCGVSGGVPNSNFWIMKTDADLRTEWSQTYDGYLLYSIVETDDGGFLAAGPTDQSMFAAIRTDEAGDIRWNRTYGSGTCYAVLELKNSNYLLSGYSWDGAIALGYLVMINPDGEVIWQRSYERLQGGHAIFLCGRETDGGIVVAGSCGDRGPSFSTCWALKVDFEGEPIWMSDTIRVGEGTIGLNPFSIVSDPAGGFLTGGTAFTDEHGAPALLKLSSEGEWLWSRQLGDFNNDPYQCQMAGRRNDGFVFTGTREINGRSAGFIFRLNDEGEIRWSSVVESDDQIYLGGVIFGEDGSIMASGHISNGDNNWNGLIVEIEPEVVGPTIVFHAPNTVNQVIMPSDSILFLIRATNQWNDEITYAFFKDDEQIAADSTITVQFNDLGEFLITGRAYSGGDSAQVVWNVEVTELYIAAQTPDTLNLRFAPGRQIDFSIDSIRAVGGNENLSYQWSTLNLDNGERGDAGREPRATIPFPEDGRYQVDGLAYRGEQSDHVVWNVRVRAGVLDIGNATLDIESGQIARLPITIYNDEADTLHWEAVANTRGEAGSEPWTLRQRFQVSEITSDDRIESVIFDGESYFCAGANGNDPNMIYHLDRDGELLRSFPQPGHSRFGFKDMEWDGELIWGSGEDTVYAVYRDGDVVHRWAAPSNPTTNIAFDPDEQILWLSGTTTDIKAYDRDGNYLDRTISRQGLRIYGLGWFADDPDGSPLYAMNTPNADTTQINKFDTQTGEMQFVTTIPRDSTTSFNSAFICRNFDKYQGSVLMTVANIVANFGGDQLRILQLQPNTEWLTVSPESGEIPSGGEADVEVRISTESWNRDWVFEVGEYEGEIVFTHDGQGARDVLPVHLTVVEPDEVGGGDGYGDPSSFELSAPYPNPFNSSATIAFGLDKSAPTRLGIYDLQGRLVEVLVSGRLTAGRHSVVWNGADLPAGVYLLRLETGGMTRVTKAVIMK